MGSSHDQEILCAERTDASGEKRTPAPNELLRNSSNNYGKGKYKNVHCYLLF